MRALIRYPVLIFCAWLMLAGSCFGKQVYLKDGGIIDARSAWRQGHKVFVVVNRDIVVDFNRSEIDLRRTFPNKTVSAGHTRHKTTNTAAPGAPAPPAAPSAAKKTPVKPQVQTAPAVTAAAAKPAAQAAAPPPATKENSSKKDPAQLKKPGAMPIKSPPQHKPVPLPFLLAFPALLLLIIAAQWFVFTKAGQAGWKCLIPFYNMYVLMQIAGKPGWWVFLLFIPLVGVAVLLFAMLSLAKKFGRSELFGVGLLLLPMIFFPLLAFGGSQYEG